MISVVVHLIGAALSYALAAMAVISPCGCPQYAGYVNTSSWPGFEAKQCAYPSGACVWDEEYNGNLLNRGQPNCQIYISYATPGCPADLTGAAGTLIHTLVGYECYYEALDNPGNVAFTCTWNAIGDFYWASEDARCTTVSSCVLT